MQRTIELSEVLYLIESRAQSCPEELMKFRFEFNLPDVGRAPADGLQGRARNPNVRNHRYFPPYLFQMIAQN